VKILLATHFFPPGHPGGTEAYTYGLARKLSTLGHTPQVICAEDWGLGDTSEPRHVDTEYDGIPVRRLYWNWQLAADPFVNLYDNPAVERHFAEYLSQLQPDVVHVTSCYSLGAGILRVAGANGIPVFLTLTDFWFLCFRHTLLRSDGSLCEGPESAAKCLRCISAGSNAYRAFARVLPDELVVRGLLGLTRWPQITRRRGLRGFVGETEVRLRALRLAYQHADAVIAPTQFLADVFVQNGFPSDRMRVSHYGLDTSWLSRVREREPGARPCLGYIGQIDPIKGVHLLIQAFQSVSAEVSAELRIYGSLAKLPRYSDELRRLAGTNPNIRFMGSFERPQVAEVFSELDALVVPSVWYENGPVAIAEAFAAGKPVLATDLGGMSELVEHEVNGLLFERGNIAQLAHLIRRFVGDPGLRERLRRGIKPVRTLEQEAGELLQLYNEALDRADGTTLARPAV
jgi:glycosyltransferase involved in cell wall biosynthesis